MAITDLTGTKWLFNSSLNVPEYFDANPFHIDFVSNGLTFSWIRFENLMKTKMYYVPSGSGAGTMVYNNSWSDESYRTIEITGGTDSINTTLISWLQSNATQIQDESNPISVGNLPIANMYFGTQQVKKVYMGNALVWEKEN